MRALVVLFILICGCAVDTVDPVTACKSIHEHECGAIKECGGDVTACVQALATVCAGATQPLTPDDIAACVSAVESHTCALHSPVFSTEATACLVVQ